MGTLIPFQRKLKTINEYRTRGVPLPMTEEFLKELEGDPTDKFIFQVTGDSMEPVIFKDDQLLVDQGIVKKFPVEKFDTKLVIAKVNDDFQMARLKVTEKCIYTNFHK